MNSPIRMPSTFPVTCHTDFVGPGSIFVAIEGYVDNGVNYIKQAIEKGARKIIVHHNALLNDELLLCMQKYAVIIERVDNTRKSLAELSAHAAGFPAKNLKIIGITGTKGKTTTAFLLEHMLYSAGYRTALISSAKNCMCGYDFAASLTTPQPDYLQQFLKLCVEHNVDYVVMEVAAQALTLHRVDGIIFCGAIFINFSLEHLEFYPTLADYFYAKTLLFGQIADNAPLIINADDEHGRQLLTHHRSARGYGFTYNYNAYYSALFMHDPTKMVSFYINDISGENGFNCPILFGAYNGYNVLAATCMALELKIEPAIIQQALYTFTGVPGRLQEHVLPNGARCFIDYAHNPESFSAVLSTLRALTSHLIVVFGAGGGKDKSKRPMMGDIASRIADIVIVTSDNPRLEDEGVIAEQIMCGISEDLCYKIVQELDRQKAIELAYHVSDQGSIIALLGKGPDEYQIIGTTKHYFSEKTILEHL